MSFFSWKVLEWDGRCFLDSVLYLIFLKFFWKMALTTAGLHSREGRTHFPGRWEFWLVRGLWVGPWIKSMKTVFCLSCWVTSIAWLIVLIQGTELIFFFWDDKHQLRCFSMVSSCSSYPSKRLPHFSSLSSLEAREDRALQMVDVAAVLLPCSSSACCKERWECWLGLHGFGLAESFRRCLILNVPCS